MNLDMGVRALALQPGFKGVRGLVIGRYALDGRIDRAKMTAMIKNIPALANLRYLPENMARLVEPFCGSAAVSGQQWLYVILIRTIDPRNSIRYLIRRCRYS
jgi:hypothetical protein